MLDPLFLKELKELPRGRHFFLLRFVYIFALLCLLSVIARGAVLPSEILSGVRAVEQLSERLFFSLSVLQYVGLSLAASLVSADSVSREVASGQLDLLRLAGMTERRIVYGKLFSRLVHLYLIVASGFPVFVSMMILGNVGIERLIQIEIATILSVTLFSCMGIHASASASSPPRAIIRAFVIIFLFNSVYFTWFVTPHILFLEALSRNEIGLKATICAASSLVLAFGLIHLAVRKLKREQRETRQVVSPRYIQLLDENRYVASPRYVGANHFERLRNFWQSAKSETAKVLFVGLLVTVLALSAVISEGSHFVFVAACIGSIFFAGFVSASNPLIGASSPFRDLFLTTRLSVREILKFCRRTEMQSLRDMLIIIGSASIMQLVFHPVSTIYSVLLATCTIPFVLRVGSAVSITSRNTSAVLQTYAIIVFTLVAPLMFQIEGFDFHPAHIAIAATMVMIFCLGKLFLRKDGKDYAIMWAVLFVSIKMLSDSVIALAANAISAQSLFASPVFQLAQAAMDGKENELFKRWQNLTPLATYCFSACLCAWLIKNWLERSFEFLTDRARPGHAPRWLVAQHLPRRAKSTARTPPKLTRATA